MFECPICSDWILYGKTCVDCDKIRQLCKLYGKAKLLEILDKTMVIQQLKKTKTEEVKEEEVVEE
jgi:hypothetical protein